MTWSKTRPALQSSTWRPPCPNDSARSPDRQIEREGIRDYVRSGHTQTTGAALSARGAGLGVSLPVAWDALWVLLDSTPNARREGAILFEVIKICLEG